MGGGRAMVKRIKARAGSGPGWLRASLRAGLRRDQLSMEHGGASTQVDQLGVGVGVGVGRRETNISKGYRRGLPGSLALPPLLPLPCPPPCSLSWWGGTSY